VSTGPDDSSELVPELPDPASRRRVVAGGRPVVLAAVVGGGIALVAVVAGIVVLGLHHQGANDVATTGLASIGATLAGGFAGWIARGAAQSSPRRRDDLQ
jgi:hypothetical protein